MNLHPRHWNNVYSLAVPQTIKENIYTIPSEINVIDVAKIHSNRKLWIEAKSEQFHWINCHFKMWVSINEKIVIYFYYCSCLYSGNMLFFFVLFWGSLIERYYNIYRLLKSTIDLLVAYFHIISIIYDFLLQNFTEKSICPTKCKLFKKGDIYLLGKWAVRGQYSSPPFCRCFLHNFIYIFHHSIFSFKFVLVLNTCMYI